MTTNTSPSPQAISDSELDDSFNLLGLILILARRWRFIAAWAIAFALLGLAIASVMHPEYTASVTFLVEQDSTNANGLFILQRSDPTTAMLESNSVADLVLEGSKYATFEDLGKLPEDPLVRQQALRLKVRGGTSSTKSSDGVFTLKKIDSNPQRAVAVANAYLVSLQDLGDRMTFESAARTRSFYEKQMAAERTDLEKSEAALKAGQQRTGILQPVMGRLEQLRAQVQALEVQRAEQAQSSTSENPEMVRLNAQIGALQGQINEMQGKVSATKGVDVPTQNLELTRLQRDVLYHEALYSTYASQFERAHLQETFGIARIHVVDRATLPVPKTWPRSKLMTLFAGVFGFFVGVLIIGIQQGSARLRRDPASAATLHEIRQALSFRST